ncbi:DUF6958 family protein [Pararhodobacter marinus]|uniref:Uncharacterized protein n=1 Tax=Pararhodobacter marinus TaxID=2184063 RepID=A0A2U2CJ26_9RHOB|nr:hypothetical protein [Pararhodobacter marinus]PWE31890.1 hypothetical protein C4N9_02505 [Pararhodobacter marinus]
MNEKIEVENVNSPGRTTRVDRAKYEAARAALMAVLPDSAPGMTPREAQAAMVAHLPGDLFPGGEKVGWWMKCVQLDLEAKRLITRAPKAPVRLWRA